MLKEFYNLLTPDQKSELLDKIADTFNKNRQTIRTNWVSNNNIPSEYLNDLIEHLERFIALHGGFKSFTKKLNAYKLNLSYKDKLESEIKDLDKWNYGN